MITNKNGGSQKISKKQPEISNLKLNYQEKLRGLLQELENGVEQEYCISNIASEPLLRKAKSEPHVSVKKQFTYQKHQLQCSHYFPTMIQILQFVSNLNTYNKIYAHFIVNHEFRILYADKLAKQLLEGSLSSFSSNSILNFVVQEDRDLFVQKCNESIKNSIWFDYLIYSRSSLRKYDLYPELENPNNLDYFFRYMKSLSSQITPICIDLGNFQDYDDDVFWNKNLIEKGVLTKCFIFKACYSLKIPDLNRYTFSKDNIINKFKGIMVSKKLKRGLSEEKIRKEINWEEIKENHIQIKELKRNKEISRRSVSKILEKLNKRIKKPTRRKYVEKEIQEKYTAIFDKRRTRSFKLPLQNVQVINSQPAKKAEENCQKLLEDLQVQKEISNNPVQIEYHSYSKQESVEMLFEVDIEKRLKLKIHTDLCLQIRQDDDYVSQFLI